MSKDKKVDKIISEQLLRDKSKKQMKDLHKLMKKSGGDIGEKVRKCEKSKENKMPNSIYIDNPFGSTRKIETFEDFSKSTKKQFEGKVEEKTISTSLEDFYMWKDREKIDLNDDSWIKGTKEDFERPMFKNLPNQKDRFPYDILRSGNFIETKDGKIIGQINKIKGKSILLDVINDENKHELKEFDIVKLVKKIKDKDLKISSNSK